MTTDAPEERLRFPPELPIAARVADIATAINDHPVVIVAGATGSGKTTQLPKIALAMGRGLDKVIGVTQPRRIAATSVAARVATELGSPLGTDVGYQVRFDNRTSPGTYVKFMTDGILLAEIEGDPLLQRYDTIIVDEAHERSLTIDFLLGWMKRILPKRPDLKVIVSSATIEHERFSSFFGDAPVLQVEGRTFPVDVLYEPPPDDLDLSEAVANAAANITSLDPRGDILVFLPGEREIRDAEHVLSRMSLRHTVVQPLYGRLSGAEQAKVFASIPQRRIILATNVAETSITIPGIVYVVDPGLARLSRYDPRSGTTRLQIEGISQASADQRKGRCGRVRDGICVRLYDEESFRARPAYTDPEIKRTSLAGVILRMKSLGLGDVDDFPFLDPPSGKAVAEGYRTLEELGALDATKNLTPLGRRLARFPVDPRIARMILAGADLGCLPDVLVVAAALNVQDPRERPREVQEKADAAHRRFRDERSDFVALLRLWDFLRETAKKGTGALRRACKEGFLSFLRVREWGEIHRQLEDTVRELGLDARRAPKGDDALHRALLTGLLSKVGRWDAEKRSYVGARQTRFVIHPSSALAKRPPQWVMAFELVETSQLFARMAAKIEPEWLLEAGGHLLKRSYSEPHWSEASARASIREHATLFGLSVMRDRSVDYATIEPERARLMFIDHALVRGEYRSRGKFQEPNRAVLGEVARLRAKARRSDMLSDDSAMIGFFDRRVPSDVVNGKTFEAFVEAAERKDPRALVLSLADVLDEDDALSPKDYPDVVELHGTKLPITYVFDPAAEDDGITLTVPLVLVPQLDPGELDWTIPGWHADKIAALLYELPRAVRKELADIPWLATKLAGELEPFRGPMLPALARAISQHAGVEVPPDAFRTESIATYLRTTCRLVDEAGHVVASGRDIDALFARFGAKARAAWKAAAAPAPKWERSGLTAWDFGELQPFVVRKVGAQEVRSYPALVDRGPSVDLVLMESAAAAETASLAGVRRLVTITTRKLLSPITPRLPAALPNPRGAMPSRTETEVFREALVSRIVDEAFGLEGVALPRTKGEFERIVALGAPRIAGVAEQWMRLLSLVTTELTTTVTALRNAAKHPSGLHAVAEMNAQLDHLFPADLVATTTKERLVHYPRYLKAIRARLQRAVSDPRKDADKLAPLAPLWASFLAKRSKAKSADDVEALRWAFEELRVAIFAPELKPAIPVSVAKVGAALSELR